MDNKTIITLVVVIGALVLLGGGYLLYTNMSTDTQGNYSVNNDTNQNVNEQNNQNQATGTLYVTITDAAANMGSVSAVSMTVDKVEVYNNAQGWITVSSTPKTFNLLELKAKSQAMLVASADVPVNSYNQIRVSASKILVTEAGKVKEAAMPSGQITFETNMVVYGNTNSVARVDVLADKSLHKTKDGSFIFAPVITFDSSSNATVIVDTNNVVTVSGGAINPTIHVGMNVGGEMKTNFQLDQSLELLINGPVIELK
ncbi:MAG: hypothetical protein A3D44_00830 [Candidatus Staskawiczbacteria bacterium RIFCSPHIGHO2_02_FULL_42_22]|uniref:DUF4382 domain-containing protein n=1 Tax=Candidatus Staskawiczbacteria bacterium RIFCSPHIGHO2_02_FULL_42_22 TaxID=1802207 RepID=A0A1G2I3J1_9BACT|nr:MAG: hypothetical protein A3D44_00830 [Candidatus Staskawiczbacteria bacterium RIFCSPHIGHO2_02_FULL_42_22]